MSRRAPIAWVDPDDEPLVILIDPVPAPRMSKRDRFAGTRTAEAQRYFHYRDALRARPRLREMLEAGPCMVQFSLPMPPSWSDAEKADRIGTLHDEKPDLDNLLKGLFDCAFYGVRGGDKRIGACLAIAHWDMAGSILVQRMYLDSGA